MQPTIENQSKRITKSIIIGFIVISLIITNAITLKLYLSTFEVKDTVVIEDTGDELSRVKFFIKDWYDELSAKYKTLAVFHNELRFEGGEYTLTVAADRIRAVYPRGVRTFQLVYVSYIEFYEENGHLCCRLFFDGENGELNFKLN